MSDLYELFTRNMEKTQKQEWVLTYARELEGLCGKIAHYMEIAEEDEFHELLRFQDKLRSLSSSLHRAILDLMRNERNS